MQRHWIRMLAGLTLAVLLGACASSGKSASTTTAPTSSALSTSPATTSTPSHQPTPVCGGTSSPPSTYQHVVVIMLENRTWSAVGGVGFGAMPYLHSLAARCAFYSNWQETNTNQSSLTQYIGLTSGVDNPRTVNDCSPSAACRSTDDNIFRQVRAAGGTARNFVEGATSACSAQGNAAKHVPALYYFGANDHTFCGQEVRPLSELNVDQLPTLAMITPTLCNDGHDCANDKVDAWLKTHLRDILNGASYAAGATAVFVLYDEDRPVPNLLIAPTAHAGPIGGSVAGHRAALHTIDEMLGLPVLPAVQGVQSLRASAHV